MKLREQFSEVEITFDNQTFTLCEDEFYDTVDTCLEIADNYAIGFSEWCDNKASQISHGEWTNFLPNAKNCLTSKELLEIYKQENNL